MSKLLLLLVLLLGLLRMGKEYLYLFKGTKYDTCRNYS
ncbi:UNVERIFIED_CONTAM: hypothetical protein NCL1_28427 [Trichonephila clavipes]